MVVSALARPAHSTVTKCDPFLGPSNQHDAWSQMWQQHLNSTGVSAEDHEEADRLAESLRRIRGENISSSFETLKIDQRGAKAVSTDLSS